jgi:hypothetical protein
VVAAEGTLVVVGCKRDVYRWGQGGVAECLESTLGGRARNEKQYICSNRSCNTRSFVCSVAPSCLGSTFFLCVVA